MVWQHDILAFLLITPTLSCCHGFELLEARGIMVSLTTYDLDVFRPL